MRSVVVALALCTGVARADVRIVGVSAQAGSAPSLHALLEVTPNARPASDYLLDLGIANVPTIHGAKLAKGDPRATSVAIIVDDTALFLAAPAPAEGSAASTHFGASRVMDTVLTTLAGIADGRATFSVILTDASARVAVANAGSPVTTLTSDPVEQEAFDVDGALLESSRLLSAASSGARKVIVVIGVPRRPPAADLLQRLRTDGIEVFTLELDDTQARRKPLFAALTSERRRWLAREATELPSNAERMVESINSVVEIEFPLPTSIFDGRAIDFDIRLGDSSAHYDGSPLVLSRIAPPPSQGHFPWLPVVGIVSVVILGAGTWLLLRPRRGGADTPPAQVQPAAPVRTVPIREPVVVEREPDDEGTYAPPPPAFAAWFYASEGPAQGQTIAIRRTGSTTIGGAGAQIRLDGPGTRPRHAKVVARGARVSIVALPEGNTVRVGGVEVATAILEDGVFIEIGANKLLFKVTT